MEGEVNKEAIQNWLFEEQIQIWRENLRGFSQTHIEVIAESFPKRVEKQREEVKCQQKILEGIEDMTQAVLEEVERRKRDENSSNV